MTEPRRLRDPRELRAVAHPLRMAIIELLTLEGPLTASELAERLDQSPANCSWHLRKLAEHQFVEEADGAHGRRRPWRMSRIGMSWDEEDDSAPEERVAGQALTRMLLERWVDRFLQSSESVTGQWRRAAGMSQSLTWLTPEELAELNAEVQAVMMRLQSRISEPDQRPEGSRLCEMVSWGAPIDEALIP